MKKILETLRSKWPEYLLEVFVITVGILGAFGLNNWNEGRNDARTAKETLINLKRDLEETLIELDNKIEQNRRFYEADSIVLLSLIRKPLSKDSLEIMLLKHYYTPLFNPSVGSLNEIISTGKLELIKSHQLRKHISAWSAVLENLSETDARLLNLDNNVKSPLYRSYLAYGNVGNLSSSRDYHYPQGSLGDSIQKKKWNHELLTGSNEFENMLLEYMFFGDLQLYQFINIKEILNEMIQLIDQEL